MIDADLITTSLESLAERVDDLTPRVYARFFALCPEAEALFVDRSMTVKGKMLNEIFLAIMDSADGAGYIKGLVESQVGNHDGWGVRISMYIDFFIALLETVQAELGSTWSAEMHAAWQRQIDSIMLIVRTSISR